MRLWIFSHLICFSTFIAMLTIWQSPVTPWHPKMCCLLCSLTQSNTVVPLKDRDGSWLLHPVNISLQLHMNHPLWPYFQIFHSPSLPCCLKHTSGFNFLSPTLSWQTLTGILFHHCLFPFLLYPTARMTFLKFKYNHAISQIKPLILPLILFFLTHSLPSSHSFHLPPTSIHS